MFSTYLMHEKHRRRVQCTCVGCPTAPDTVTIHTHTAMNANDEIISLALPQQVKCSM